MAIHKLQGNREFELEVVGESHYQGNLETICGPKKREGVNLLVEAHLIREPDNPFDRNAVRVEIQNRHVGYLPRDAAKDYNIIFMGLKLPANTVLAVDGQIRGGWKRSDGKEAHYGVRLDFPTDINGAKQLNTIAKKSKRGCCGLFIFVPIFTAIISHQLF